MKMPNNLEIMIAKSGMTKRNVAEVKGITPETLSRHVHGKIQMTLQDAEQYAKILDCTPQDILFAQKPVKIIGYVHYNENRTIKRSFAEGKTLGKVYLHNHMQKDTAAIIFSVDKNYTGKHVYWNNAVAFVKRSPITNGDVDPESIMYESFVKIIGEIPDPDESCSDNFLSGVVYPEPGGTYTIHNTDTDKIRQGLKLEWATPLLSVCFRPDLRSVEVVLDK